MYKLEYLPIAKQDIDGIIYYVSNILKNVDGARKLAKSFVSAADSIIKFPYGIPAYNFRKKLKNEYRCFKVNNFLMFYTINENARIITVVRVDGY